MEVLSHREPDLIFIYPLLRSMNGFDLCERIKSRRETCLIPVMVLGLWTGFRSGSNVHLELPFRLDEVDAAVDRALSWPRTRASRRGVGEVVFDIGIDDEWMRQANDLIVDVLDLTPLPEEQVREVKKVVLEMGDKLIEFGKQRQHDRIATAHWRVKRDRISLAIRPEGGLSTSLKDVLRRSLHDLIERCGFVATPQDQTPGELDLNRFLPS
jgi:DNA-binding response OmpR family regulator